MPGRSRHSVSNSPTTNGAVESTSGCDPEHEEFDEQRFRNRERAFVAASRRTDRTIEARIQSAMMASRYHLRLHGRALKINEEVVRGDGIYEEIEDPEDKRRRLKRGDLNEEEEASLANAVPGTEQYQIAQRLRHEAEVNREFAQMYSGAVAQMQMQQQQQQQQAAMMPHGQAMPQYQWSQQDQQALQMQQQYQQQQQQQYFAGPPQMFSPQQVQQSPAVSAAGAYQHSSGDSSAAMTPQQYHAVVNANPNVISPQTMMAGLEAGLNNATRYSSRSNSMPNGADMTTGLSSGSNHASPAPNAIMNMARPLPRHSFSSPRANSMYAGVPGLSNNSVTTNSTPSVSTPTSQDSATYVVAPHGGNLHMPVTTASPAIANPVIRHDSNSSGMMVPTYGTDLMTAESLGKAADSNAWTGAGVPMPYAVPTGGDQYNPISPTQPNDMAWVTTYAQQAPVLATAGPQSAAILGYPPHTASFGNEVGYQQQHNPGQMGGPSPIPSRNMAAASELMKRQLSSRIGTPGGSAGDQWTDWVQFNDEAI
ncbi:hypothetical protein SBRCBS47491_007575 [Sporothrix bragantina]|uniref:Uncharacterized protein n=1 Tax=Sporothrix bragantina TaxID=671064 RepID=A0ABP0CEC8_9PEZI